MEACVLQSMGSQRVSHDLATEQHNMLISNVHRQQVRKQANQKGQSHSTGQRWNPSLDMSVIPTQVPFPLHSLWLPASKWTPSWVKAAGNQRHLQNFNVQELYLRLSWNHQIIQVSWFTPQGRLTALPLHPCDIPFLLAVGPEHWVMGSGDVTPLPAGLPQRLSTRADHCILTSRDTSLIMMPIVTLQNIAERET